MYSILTNFLLGGAFIGGLLGVAYAIHEVLLIKWQMPEKEALKKALKLVAEIEKKELILAEKKQKLETIRLGTMERIERAKESMRILEEFNDEKIRLQLEYDELSDRNKALKERNRMLEIAISAAEGLTSRRR